MNFAIPILIAVLSVAFALYASQGAPLKFLALLGLAAYHALYVFLFYDAQLATGSDASYYYNFGTENAARFLSTDLLLFLAAVFRDHLGASLLDEFYIFQFFGLVGIILLLNVALSAAKDAEGWRKLIIPAFALSPGLHFWTVALGKDSLSIFALGLVCHGLASKRIGKTSIALGLLIITLVRPHVGLIMGGCILFSTLIWSRRATGAIRLAGIIGGSVAGVVGLGFVLAGLGLDTLGTDEASIYIDKLSEGNSQAGSGLSVTGMIYPLRMLAFLFLPFFLDANNLNALVLSFDNALYMFMFGFVLMNARYAWNLSRSEYVIGFSYPAFILLTIVLTLGSSNVGLASRQKMMVVPLLPIAFAYLQCRKEKVATLSARDCVEVGKQTFTPTRQA